jgi:hypothetical protein
LDRSPGMVLWDHLILRPSAAMRYGSTRAVHRFSSGANLQHKDGAYNEKHMYYSTLYVFLMSIYIYTCIFMYAYK